MNHYLLAINNAMGQPVRLPLLPAPPRNQVTRASPTPLLAAKVYGSWRKNKMLWLPVGQLPVNHSTWCQNNLLRLYRSKRSINLAGRHD